MFVGLMGFDLAYVCYVAEPAAIAIWPCCV